uniref:Thioredoxin domain-containing protein n=1 Tax=Timema genevievae TaxID=629358 RepID=A0A7R9PRD8_TIMGE|nr:unnamed protein product [Timema genevievae]
MEESIISTERKPSWEKGDLKKTRREKKRKVVDLVKIGDGQVVDLVNIGDGQVVDLVNIGDGQVVDLVKIGDGQVVDLVKIGDGQVVDLAKIGDGQVLSFIDLTRNDPYMSVSKAILLPWDVLILFDVQMLITAVISSRVLELSDRFLDIRKDGHWLVMFYAPWCAHCKRLEPVWAHVAQNLHNTNIRVGRVDCTRFTSLATEFSVSGFPTIML